MIEKLIQQTKSAVGSRVARFGRSLKESPPFLSRNNSLVFLCGANQAIDNPSERRKALKKFIEKEIKDCRVIYAEAVFEELSHIGGKKNLLDMEYGISKIADKIMIVLESESAFCELGAFSHDSVREKLIIINNKKFKNSKSFINEGPIAAAVEKNLPVLWYEMTEDGVNRIDSIGTIFPEIKRTLLPENKSIKQRSKVDFFKEEKFKLDLDKLSMFLVHDVVYIMGVANNKEIMAFFNAAFGKSDYSVVKQILGVLRSSGLVKVGAFRKECIEEDRVYKSNERGMMLEYDFDVYSLMSTFRSSILRSDANRLKAL